MRADPLHGQNEEESPHAVDRRGEKNVLEAVTVLAVGASAVAFVAGVGTYLYIRFTQNRRKLSKDRASSAKV